MPRAEEIAYYSQLVASLTVSAAREQQPERLKHLHDALAEAFTDVFTLLSHDAIGPNLEDRLAAAAAALAASTEARDRRPDEVPSS